jgi:hypothetical protein
MGLYNAYLNKQIWLTINTSTNYALLSSFIGLFLKYFNPHKLGESDLEHDAFSTLLWILQSFNSANMKYSKLFQISSKEHCLCKDVPHMSSSMYFSILASKFCLLVPLVKHQLLLLTSPIYLYCFQAIH